MSKKTFPSGNFAQQRQKACVIKHVQSVQNNVLLVKTHFLNFLTLLKPGFHMSRKSQTIGDFTVSRRSQILSTNENSKSWISPIVWDEDKSGESGAFLFPDASQFSAMIGDHSRQIKTQNCTVGLPLGTSAMGFAHYQSPKLLGSSPPITQVSIFCALSISGQIHRENLRQTCKSKILDRLGFSDM